MIIDFKTSASTPTAEKAEHLNQVQTSSYATLYREATGRVESGIGIHTLVKLKTPKLVVTNLPPMRDSQQARLFRMIESYLSGVDQKDWVPSPGLHCAACEFFNECRAWCG
jgi:putative RecB family exonuclease